jgi:Zn-dependent peptidase ImmA (M78 family)
MQIRRKINDDKWTISIVTPKEMKKHADGDKNVSGLCVAFEKAIYIRDDSVDYDTIAHELFHAYFSYLCLSSTNDIKLEDAEEISCTMFAAKGQIMVKKAKQFTRELKKLHEKGNE